MVRMGNSYGAVPSYDTVEMDEGARRRLVRALESGVPASALTGRSAGHSADALYRIARRAGWDGVRRSNRCESAAGTPSAVSPECAAGPLMYGRMQ